MRRLVGTALLILLCAGCATAPRPDGDRIERLAEPAAPAALSPEDAQRLAELNAPILREPSVARAHAERRESLRQLGPPPHVWPHFDGGWAWTGHGWAWRPRWGLGFGWYGAWPY